MGIFDLMSKANNDENAKLRLEKPLQSLVDMALCDNVLTDAECELLLSSAKEAGCNIDEFKKYLDAQIKERKINKTSSKKFIIRNTDNVAEPKLKVMLDMAIADGVISDEERLILLTEAKSYGLNLSDFNKMLDLITSKVIDATTINSGAPSKQIISKELISTTTTADGKIQEVWKEVSLEKRPDTRQGATPGAQITVKVSRTITITKSAAKTEVFSLSSAVDLLTTLDYDMILTGVNVASIFFPAAATIISPIIITLQKSANDYKASTAPNKQDLYLQMLFNNISFASVFANLPIVQKYIPCSDKVIQCLDVISKNKK